MHEHMYEEIDKQMKAVLIITTFVSPINLFFHAHTLLVQIE